MVTKINFNGQERIAVILPLNANQLPPKSFTILKSLFDTFWRNKLNNGTALILKDSSSIGILNAIKIVSESLEKNLLTENNVLQSIQNKMLK
ncbi:MAG: hypothetical protein MJ211_07455 [Bacteroidales bacterium]|nr:hypothetical protein [Bacteroidales bacterium]